MNQDSGILTGSVTENAPSQTSLKRDGEEVIGFEIPSRGSRFFKLDNNWYFTTREGFSMGPFDSYELASKGTEDYLAFVSTATPPVLKLLVADAPALRG